MALRNISNLQQMSAHMHMMKQATIKPTIAHQVYNSENPANVNNGTTTSSGSIQIRTSSPISSSSGSELSGPANTVISPSKFMKAVHCSRRNNQQNKKQCVQHPPSIQNYVSMKELAYEKLRKQQSIEKELRQAFNINEAVIASDSLHSNGKLKVSIYNNMNHLSINIVEARDLKHLPHKFAETYVKCTMLPDQEKRFKKCQTGLVQPTVRERSNGKQSLVYKYDAKYSFEFDNASDMRNRLIVSVWCVYPSSSNQNKLEHFTLGCFSFKLKHLMKQSEPKGVWYHLLPLKFGLTRHIKCESKSGSGSKSNGSSQAWVSFMFYLFSSHFFSPKIEKKFL
jgi:hypothetical protein